MAPRSQLVPKSPEAALARLTATGDPAALDALFDSTAPQLFRAAVALTGDAATAEDALQETYLAALSAAPSFEPGRPVVPWLLGILRHKAAHARRRKRRAAGSGEIPDSARETDELARLAGKEDAARVRGAIEALREPYRSVALLRWRYGLTPAQIAHVRGEPPGTIWSLLSRALDRLKRTLKYVPMALLGWPAPRGLSSVREALASKAAEASGLGASLLGASGIATAKPLALALGVVVSGALAIGTVVPRSTTEPARTQIVAAGPSADSHPSPLAAAKSRGRESEAGGWWAERRAAAEAGIRRARMAVGEAKATESRFALARDGIDQASGRIRGAEAAAGAPAPDRPAPGIERADQAVAASWTHPEGLLP